jgi:hypothetical protein
MALRDSDLSTGVGTLAPASDSPSRCDQAEDLDSPKNIARLNIEHYRRQLADETGVACLTWIND